MKNKISITAEFASLIKSESDPHNLYFASPTTRVIYRICRFVLLRRLLKDISIWRTALTQLFDSVIEKEIPKQIIDLGAGYSLRGFDLCRKNSDLIYIDSDLEDVILRKKDTLAFLCKKEGINFPTNLHLVALDVLTDDFFQKLQNYAVPDRKTLILAEGLTSYFTEAEFKLFLSKVRGFCAHFPDSIFYSHEGLAQPKGALYKAIRRGLSFITHSQKSRRFKTANEFTAFLKECNITKYKLQDSNSGHLIYSLTA